MSRAYDLFRLVRSNSDFAKLWSGVTISDLGSSVTNFALPLQRYQVATSVKLLAGRQHY